MGILKILKAERGSLMVEASILLPVLIIAVICLSYIMRFMNISDDIHFGLTGKAREAAVYSHFAPQELMAANLAAFAKSKKTQDYTAGSSALSFRDNDAICLKTSFDLHVRLPISYIGERKLEQTLLYRPWIGKEPNGPSMLWSDMEKEGEGETVYVFPRSGEKYHDEYCSYITNVPTEMLLTPEVKKKYEPCSLCRPKLLPDYSIVYCYTRSGKVFHSKTCALVEKYVVPLQEEEALEKGYTPCKKCKLAA